MINPIPGRRCAVLVLLALVTCASRAEAQVGVVNPLPYPGWESSDRVAPTISVEASYGHMPGLWRYRYVVANGATAAQDLWHLGLVVGGWVNNVGTPTGWLALPETERMFSLRGPGFSAVQFLADIPDTSPGNYFPPSPYQIAPGGSLSGFEFHSPFPPGYVRTWAQGYAPVPFPPTGEEEDPSAYEGRNPEPHDTVNAQRGWTLGPSRYQGVMTRGSLNVEGSEGFLGFMNLALSGTVLRAPAPVALKLSLGGEKVFPETFRAVLNGVDVTAWFHPGTAGGADMVAVFALGTLPVQQGRNVLTTTIEGMLPGLGRRGIDEDVIQFDIVP